MNRTGQIKQVTARTALALSLCVLLGCDRLASSRTSTESWYTEDLEDYSKVDWDPTDEVPLSPDAAVRACLLYLEELHGTDTQWKVSRVDLHQDYGTPWMYDVWCENSHGTAPPMIIVKVLLSGEIWRTRKTE